MGTRGSGPRAVAESATGFGILFSDLRVAKGFSTRELATRVGYNPKGGANFSKYERGTLLPPPPEIILDWMDALGYDDKGPEVQHLMSVALEDQLAALYESYAPFLLERSGA